MCNYLLYLSQSLDFKKACPELSANFATYKIINMNF